MFNKATKILQTDFPNPFYSYATKQVLAYSQNKNTERRLRISTRI